MDDLKRLTFPVRKVKVMDVMGPEIKAVKKGITHAIVKESNAEVLSFVSQDYELLKNHDIVESFLEFFDKQDINVVLDFSAYSDVRFKILFSLTDYTMEITSGDSIYPIFYVSNSYNRSQRYLFGVTVQRGVCRNVLTPWARDKKIDMLHTPGAGIAVEESLELIEDFIPTFEETLDPYYELADREMSTNAMANRIQEVIEETKFPVGLGEMAQDRAIEEITKYGFDPSDWVVYNALNYQLNHNADNLLGRKADSKDREVLTYLMNY